MQLLSYCLISVLLTFVVFKCNLQTTIANYMYDLKLISINSAVLCEICITMFKLLIAIWYNKVCRMQYSCFFKLKEQCIIVIWKDVVFIANMLCNQWRSVVSADLLRIDSSKINTNVMGSKWMETKMFSVTLVQSCSRDSQSI